MRSSRSPIIAAVAAALALPAGALAQFGLPDPTQVITQTTDPITGAVTGTVTDPTSTITSTVTDPTGTIGGVIDTTTSTLDGATGGTTGTITDPIVQTVDQVLGGTLATLPAGTIDELLGAAGLAGANGANGASGGSGVTVLPDGTVVIDKRPPNTTVKVLDRNGKVGRSGKLRLQISSDEPSVVALAGSVKPGRAWKLHGRAKKLHSRKSIAIPKVVLAYRKAGALRLTIQFSRRAQRNIRHSYNSSVRLSLVAVDVARNQVTRKLNRVVKH
jgi:hypothetical protein